MLIPKFTVKEVNGKFLIYKCGSKNLACRTHFKSYDKALRKANSMSAKGEKVIVKGKRIKFIL